jgi:dimethylargininase
VTRIALTRAVPASMASCELTHLERSPIDVRVATAQHDAYEAALRDAGCIVRRVAPAPDLPDSVFVEDCAVLLGRDALITRPGAASRRAESASVQAALQEYCRIHTMHAPATLDGGDVLVAGSRLFVGDTDRTNRAGFDLLDGIARDLGYTAVFVPVTGCLHLKTAATALDDRTVLINGSWIDPFVFDGLDVVDIDAREPFAANVLRMGDAVLMPAAHPRTAERLRARGCDARTVDLSEFARAEGGITCCSIILEYAP